MTKTPVLNFEHLNFGFVSHFDIRVSDLLIVEPISQILHHITRIIHHYVKGGLYGEEQGICKAFAGNGGV
jgi:hypothetical protein